MDAGQIVGMAIYVFVMFLVPILLIRRQRERNRIEPPAPTAKELLRQARAIKQAEHQKAIQAWQSEYDRLTQPDRDQQFWDRIAAHRMECPHTEWVEVSNYGDPEKRFMCLECAVEGRPMAHGHGIKPTLYWEDGGHGLGRGERLRADR